MEDCRKGREPKKTMKLIRAVQIWGMLLGALLLFWPQAAPATELLIPGRSVQAGQPLEVPIKLDKVDNLAGVKLKLTYDPGVLTFLKAAKTDRTSSLMHIVNDKTPGLLIIVMAGAVGVKGEQFAILALTFATNKDLTKPVTTTVKIMEAQLMTDRLQDIEFTTATQPFTIAPSVQKPDPAPHASSLTPH